MAHLPERGPINELGIDAPSSFRCTIAEDGSTRSAMGLVPPMPNGDSSLRCSNLVPTMEARSRTKTAQATFRSGCAPTLLSTIFVVRLGTSTEVFSETVHNTGVQEFTLSILQLVLRTPDVSEAALLYATGPFIGYSLRGCF